MIAVFLLVALATDEPRFTRTEAPDAVMRAEAYRRDGGPASEQALRLLGREPNSTEVAETPQGSVTMLMAHPSDVSPGRVAVYATLGERDDFICVLTEQQQGGRDNAVAALRWCTSFLFDPPRVVRLEPPAVPPPGPPEG